MKKWDDFIKEIFSKKYVANIVAFMAVAIIALIASNEFFGYDTASKNNTSKPAEEILVQREDNRRTEEEKVEQRLQKILEKIQGAGDVEVMITFEIGTEVIPAVNTVSSEDNTEEKDSSGGTRTITSRSVTENVVIADDSSGNKPIVLKEIKPQVKGVIVVAEGADDVQVKARLYEAVKTVLQIPGYKVQVYPKE